MNPVTGRADLASYKVYRSEVSFIGPYTLIRSISPGFSLDMQRYYDAALGKWKYIDQSINIGAGYFYYVTAVDSAKREGGPVNRNEQPIYAIVAPTKDVLSVRVFPNPFREVSGFPTTGDENSIVWANIPEECTIRVYTSSGELVKTLHHQSTSSGQEVWNQLADARQVVAPGIYFWTLQSSVGNTRGTLLIIK